MLVHNNPLFSIYFGNAEDELDPDEYLHYPPGIRLLELESYKKLKRFLHLDRLTFLHQVHSNRGVIITPETFIEPFKQDGDYLVTNQKQSGIGSMTADCLPIVFYDNMRHVVAIAHAGWKGSVQQIAPTVIGEMQQQFGTNVEQLRIFFGPSAKGCCYEVDESFPEHLEPFAFGHQALRKEEHRLMFDLPLFNRLQLEDMGIAKEALKLDYNFCTMCDPSYCSYRRRGKKGHRQMTVVALK